MLDNANWYRRRDGLDRFISWLEGHEKTPTNGMTAKTACLLDMQARSECNSDRLGRLCTQTVESLWNFTAKSAQAMRATANLMLMRSREQSIGKESHHVRTLYLPTDLGGDR